MFCETCKWWEKNNNAEAIEVGHCKRFPAFTSDGNYRCMMWEKKEPDDNEGGANWTGDYGALCE